MTHTRKLVLLLLGGVVLPMSGLNAAGSGGSGMSASPSVEAPRYDPTADYQAGTEALNQSRFADAKKAFDRVLGAVPRDANANYMAGLARVGLNDSKGAVRYFAKAIKADDNMIAAHKEYGLALVATGDRAKAQAELDALKARQGQCGEACAQAADLHGAVDAITAALGAAPQAARDLSSGLMFASAQDGDRAYLDAVALINDHRYEAAIQSLEQARRVFGPHPDILTYLGFANRKLKRYDVAESYYRQALQIAPQHRGAIEYYGEMMVERGELARAGAMLARLDTICTFGCYEAEELRHWIASGHGSPS